MSQTLAGAAARAARVGAGPATTSPARAPRPSVRRPPLRVVQAPPTAGSPLGFAMVCAALLGAGLIVLLLLNTAVAQDSFGLQRLKAGAQTLADQKQALIQNNDLAAAPAQLSAKAWSLGLVPASGTAFIQLPSGKVMGVANPAPRAKPPTVITSTTSTTGTSSKATKLTGSPSSGSAPGQAPAITVDRTARAGAAPPVAPAAPLTTTGTTSGTTTGTTTHTTNTTKTP